MEENKKKPILAARVDQELIDQLRNEAKENRRDIGAQLSIILIEHFQKDGAK